jgi:hypothetical protein
MDGTMTPPRDEDATCDDFAPVIPLRRRQHDVEPPAAGDTLEADSCSVWDPDAPIPGLAERPSVWEQPSAPELLVRSSHGLGHIDPGASDATPRRAAGSPRWLRRRLVLAAAVSALLAATAATVIVAGSGGAHTHTAHRTATVSAGTPGRTVAGTRSAMTATHTPAPSVAPKTALRSHRAARHRSKRATHRHAAVSTLTHADSSNALVGASLPSVPIPQPSTSVRPAQAGVVDSRTAGNSAASSCVPGELGC